MSVKHTRTFEIVSILNSQIRSQSARDITHSRLQHDNVTHNLQKWSPDDSSSSRIPAGGSHMKKLSGLSRWKLDKVL